MRHVLFGKHSIFAIPAAAAILLAGTMMVNAQTTPGIAPPGTSIPEQGGVPPVPEPHVSGESGQTVGTGTPEGVPRPGAHTATEPGGPMPPVYGFTAPPAGTVLSPVPGAIVTPPSVETEE